MTFRRRLEFTAQTKRDAFDRSGGVCECYRIPWLKRPDGCGVKLVDGAIYYEHVNPDNIRHDNSLDNCAVLTRTCWREKTDRYDRKVIAKSNHVRDGARGIKQPSFRPMPFGKRDKFKQKMNGTVVLRSPLVNQHGGRGRDRHTSSTARHNCSSDCRSHGSHDMDW